MKIAISADYRGYECKNEIIKRLKDKYEFIDFGTNSSKRDDYPVYGFMVGEAVRDKKADMGIAVCNSAVGVSIACNKVNGIRCAKINNLWEAVHAKENDHCNCLALSANLGVDINVEMIEAFINSKEKIDDPAYPRRVEQITKYEKDGKYDS